MATTRKTTSKTASAAKTKPAKKPTTKPAGASVKPKAYKKVTTKSTTNKNTDNKTVSSKKHETSKVIFVIILALALMALCAGVITCIIKQGLGGNNVVLIENGNGDKVKTKYISLAGESYQVAVPVDFVKSDRSSDDEFYFTNEDETVVITITKPASSLTNAGVKKYTEAMSTVLAASMTVDDTSYYDVNDHTIGVITASTKNAFSEMAFFSINDKMVMVSFTCDESSRAEWEKVGNNIIHSIRF